METQGSLGLRRQFGGIDIYLFDQLLRGRIQPGHRIFDAGCGGGRYLVYFLREGHEVRAVDADPTAVDSVRRMAPEQPAENFQVAELQNLTGLDDWADVVISSAVLHFAKDDAHFEAMLRGMWRVLKPGGLFFCRLASTIGLEPLPRPLGGRRYLLPDGSERFLVDEAMLMRWTAELGGELEDPLKTTLVQGLRSMTTWVVRKNA